MVKTYTELYKAVSKAMTKNKHHRKGQVWFNTVYEYFPEIANKVRGNSSLDPFYQDNNISAFIDFVTMEILKQKE